MKDLHADFVKRVTGTNNIVQAKVDAVPDGLQHTAITVYQKKDDSSALLVVAKYVWVQTPLDDGIPSLEAMIQSQIYLFDEEIPLFLSAVKATTLDAE